MRNNMNRHSAARRVFAGFTLVETIEQVKFLREHACEYGQGYFFARPLPFGEIQRFFDPNVALMRQPRKRPPH